MYKYIAEMNKTKGEKTIYKTTVSFNCRNSKMLDLMKSILDLANEYDVEVGQEIESGWDSAGLISYLFAINNPVVEDFDIFNIKEFKFREATKHEIFLKEVDDLIKVVAVDFIS